MRIIVFRPLIAAVVLAVGVVATANSNAARVSTGTLEGIVRWTGAVAPRPTMVRNETDPDVCGQVHTLEDFLVSDQNNGLKNVIVALANVPEENVPARVPGRLRLDNVDCRFTPHAAVLTVGDVIQTHNSDQTLHTTHLYGPSEINLARPLQGMTLSRTADTAGMIVVKCDVHGWMQAFIRVDDHPFHAVTDASGRFRIADAPVGEYVLEAWHETLGMKRLTVAIRGGETAAVELDWSAGE